MAKVGIIGAMEEEVSILIEKMESSGNVKKICAGELVFYAGTINKTEVVVVKSGIGKVNAALCAQRLILQFDVTHIINTGIAGALGGNLKIFDMVASTDAVYHDMDAVLFGYKPTQIPGMKISEFKADENLIKKAELAFEKTNSVDGRKILAGRIATGDQFIADKEKKEYIKKICSPLCVEMEGAAIAHACFLNKVPYLILRCISDMADESVEATYSFNESVAAQESAKVVIEMLENFMGGIMEHTEGHYKVDSFNLDHTKVTAPFVRLASKKVGQKGDVVTKFDIRFTQPNKEFMTTGAIHTLEHLVAEYIRDEIDGVIDFSPMGCRTGFYFTVFGDVDEEFIAKHLLNVLKKVAVWNKVVPAATEKECGNYRDHDLEGAKKYALAWVNGIESKGWNCYK